MQGLHPRTQQKSRRLKEEPHMNRQRKHRTYGVSAVCRKSAGIEKHTGSDSARSIRIPNVEEAAVTEQLGETEPGKSALSFHRTGGETWGVSENSQRTRGSGPFSGAPRHFSLKYVSIPAKKCLAQRKNPSLPGTSCVFRYTLG